MATTLDSRPSATTLDVEELVKLAWAGKIRVPHFQRDFRWSWEDVRRLFDSIVKGYPVGSLLLWTRKATAQTVQLGALQIKAPASEDAFWVVDGQQRLTSLANALHPDGGTEPRFALAYHLAAEEFIKTPSVEDPLAIPLPVIFDLQQILRWFAEHPEISEHLDQATAITRKIRQFEVPAYLVRQGDPHVLQDIFDRMNNYGKRLSRAEIFSALNAGDENARDDSLTFEKIAEHIDIDLQFGILDNETVLAAVLARRGPEVRRDIRNEFLAKGDEGREAAYRAGEEALHRAVRFLQNDVGVPHVSMLAYRYILVVLARVFAFFPDPDPRNKRLLKRWYWRAAIASPEHFRGGTPAAARVLCNRVTSDSLTESVQGLLSAVEVSNPRTLDLTRFATNEAATKILLTIWWSYGPRNPETWEQYTQADLAAALVDRNTARDAVQYLIPRRAVAASRRPWASDRVLMPIVDIDARELPDIISLTPKVGGEDRWQEMILSHCITRDMAQLLASGSIDKFLDARQSLLDSRARQFLELACEWKFENTPPLSDLFLNDEDDIHND